MIDITTMNSILMQLQLLLCKLLQASQFQLLGEHILTSPVSPAAVWQRAGPVSG